MYFFLDLVLDLTQAFPDHMAYLELKITKKGYKVILCHNDMKEG